MLLKMLIIIPFSFWLTCRILLLGILTTIKQGHLEGEEMFGGDWIKYHELLKKHPIKAGYLLTILLPIKLFKNCYDTRHEMKIILIKKLIKK